MYIAQSEWTWQSSARGGIKVNISWEPNLLVNNFAQQQEKSRHHPDNNQCKVVIIDKTGQNYTVKGSIY